MLQYMVAFELNSFSGTSAPIRYVRASLSPPDRSNEGVAEGHTAQKLLSSGVQNKV